MKLKSRGFTLIELLVVVAIISLLSSMVLASVKDARTKAQGKAFRAEVSQLINALELYKSDNRVYPGETSVTIYYYYNFKDGVGDNVISDPNNFYSQLQPYIKELPEPTQSGGGFYYFRSSTIRCAGDAVIPPYVLLITSNEPGFSDLPYSITNGVLSTNFRCFSLK